MTQGVLYKILNLSNGCCYVGSTLHEKQRLARHLRHLRKGKHVNKRLQADFDYYGEENFVFEIIQRGINEQELSTYEFAAIAIEDLETEGMIYNISKAARISPQARQIRQQKLLMRKVLLYNRKGITNGK